MILHSFKYVSHFGLLAVVEDSGCSFLSRSSIFLVVCFVVWFGLVLLCLLLHCPCCNCPCWKCFTMASLPHSLVCPDFSCRLSPRMLGELEASRALTLPQGLTRPLWEIYNLIFKESFRNNCIIPSWNWLQEAALSYWMLMHVYKGCRDCCAVFKYCIRCFFSSFYLLIFLYHLLTGLCICGLPQIIRH